MVNITIILEKELDDMRFIPIICPICGEVGMWDEFSSDNIGEAGCMLCESYYSVKIKVNNLTIKITTERLKNEN